MNSDGQDDPKPPVPPGPSDEPVAPAPTDGGTYDLHPPHDAEPARTDSTITCPDCGAPMPGGKTLVCLRCGFDLKSLKRLKTSTGVAEVAEEAEPAEPLSRPGRGERWLPAALAIGGGCLLLMGHLLGAGGLFAGAAEVTFPDRLLGLLQALVQVVMLSGSGLVALMVMAQLLDTKVGNWPLAGLRMLGIVLGTRLCTLLELTPRSVEWAVETVAQLALAVALASFFYRFNWRDALSWAVVAVVAVATTWLAAGLVTWAF